MNDTISRQAAIDALWKALYEYEDKMEKLFLESEEFDIDDWIQHRIFVQDMSDVDRRTIVNMPSAEPHWIPCSEKPYPDTDGVYLITVRIGDSVFIDASHFINIDGSVFWVDHDYNFDEVIAWMPAMEPYKGG